MEGASDLDMFCGILGLVGIYQESRTIADAIVVESPSGAWCATFSHRGAMLHFFWHKEFGRQAVS